MPDNARPAPPDLPFAGRVVLVTGGSRGLGRAMVAGFARAGADVVIASRDGDACARYAEEISAATGVAALPYGVHVGHWDEVGRLVHAVYEEFGRIDVLVNNAGMSPLAPSSAETSEELFDKVVGVNFKGPFRLASLVGQRMADGDGGVIINVTSSGSLMPLPGVVPYGSAKAALKAMSSSLAAE